MQLHNYVPIPNESSRQDDRFYRPISLLPTISKCLERHIYQLLLEYLSSNQLLSDAQFGFRSGRSTVMPLFLPTHQWQTALESHKQVACVFFDLRKAFDSVPHQAILNQLHNLQVPGTSTLAHQLPVQLPPVSDPEWFFLDLAACEVWSPSGLDSWPPIISNLH